MSELTGRTRYRQTFWRRKMILQVEEQYEYMTGGGNLGDDLETHVGYRWRDATWADIQAPELG